MKEAPINVDSHPHLIIRASAGSGKTYQLSNRYLDLLHHDFSPQTMLATTFTRKAAGEILERILRRLAEASKDAEGAARLSAELGGKVMTLARAQALLKEVCRSLHRVSVSTIDSFFHRIAGSFRHELKMPPNPVLVDAADPLAVKVRGDAIAAMLGDTDIELLLDLLKRLHHDQTKRSVTEALDEIISDLYETYRVTERADWHRLQPPKPASREDVVVWCAVLTDLAQRATDKNQANAIRKALEAAMGGQWDVFLGSGLAKAIRANPSDPTYYKKPVPPHQVAAFTPMIAHAQASLLTRQAEQTSATYDLLARFDGHYTRLRDQQRILLYSDLAHKLAHDLPARGDDLLTEICYRLDGSVTHLLLDEFQDTSFEQWAILRPFAEEITAYSDRSRSFFCVGDIKQAIYGWRGGRAELFERVVTDLRLSDAAQITLDVSYRSSPIVLDVVNQVFHALGGCPIWKEETIRAEATRWSQTFGKHTAKHGTHDGYVELITSPTQESDTDEPHSREADGEHEGAEEDESPRSPAHEDFVARRIAEIARQSPAHSIGVLVSKNVAAKQLITALRNMKIDASAEGRSEITGDPAVDVVLSALRMADHPGHSAAAFHVLNSPLAPVIGLRSHFGAPCDEAAQRIRAAVFARGFASVIAEWAKALAPSCDAASGLRLTQLVELADQFEPGIRPRMREFVAMVESVQVEDPSQAQVRVMTIHKSKGLEFDIVVLPELSRMMGKVRSGTGVMIERDPASDKVLAVHRQTNEVVRSLDADLQRAYEQEQIRRLRDDLSALYVAMTRARHALHMIAMPPKLNKGGNRSSKGVTDQSFAALLRQTLCAAIDTENPAGNERIFKAGNEDWHLNPKGGKPLRAAAGSDRVISPAASPETAASSWVGSQPPRVVLAGDAKDSRRTWRQVAPSSLHGGRTLRAADLLADRSEGALLRGTLMHGWFQLIQWLDEAGGVPDDAALMRAAEKLAPQMKRRAGELVERAGEFRSMIAKAAVGGPLSRPKLGRSEKIELWREREFAVRVDGNLMRGSFDRVTIIHRDGRPIRAEILDYKTDRIDANATIASRIAHHRPQLAAYRGALATMLELDVKMIRTSILFLATGECCPT